MTTAVCFYLLLSMNTNIHTPENRNIARTASRVYPRTRTPVRGTAIHTRTPVNGTDY